MIQLLIEPSRTLLHSDFSQLLQPMLPLFYLIHSRAGCQNAAATIQCFNPEHRSLGLERKGFIGANHLLQLARCLPSVPDRPDHTSPQQLRQLLNYSTGRRRKLTANSPETVEPLLRLHVEPIWEKQIAVGLRRDRR